MFLSNVAEVYPEAGYIFFLVEEMPQYIAGISVFLGIPVWNIQKVWMPKAFFEICDKDICLINL